MEYLYVKLLLYAYPKLSLLEEAARSSAEIKAALSFRTYGDAFTVAEKVADEILIAERLRALRETMDEIVAECTDEERFLLEYKYFRRKAELAAGLAEKRPVSCSRRTYFRLQSSVLSKVAAMLWRRGYTRSRVIGEFGEYPPFRRVYRALKEGRERAVVVKRKSEGLDFYTQNSSAGAVCELLPRKTSAAIASTARQAAQIATICTAERVGAGSSAGGGSSVPPETCVR